MHYCQHFLLRCALFTLALGFSTSCSRQSNTERLLAKAAEYYAAGTYDKAEIEYLNTLKADPGNAQAIARLGLIYAEEGRTRAAFFHLQKARELLPNNFEVRTNLATYYLAFKSFNEARTETRYILEHQPSHAEAPLLFAESAQQPGELLEAKEFLGKLPTAGTAPVLTALASLEFRQNKSSEAEALLKQALALEPNSGLTNAYAGTFYVAQKNMPAAEAAFASCWKNSRPRAAQKLFYVRFKLQQGEVETARRLLTELIAAAPDCLPPMMLLAEVATRERKINEAFALSEKIIGRDQLNFPALFLRTRLRLAKGETDQAIAELVKYKEIQPRNPEIHYQLGLAYLAQNDPAKAITCLNSTVELAPNHVEAILQLTDLYLRSGEAKAANAILSPLVSQRPDFIPAKFMLARVYVSLGELNEALATYEEVAKIAPRDANLLLPLALIFRQQKKYSEARSILAKALELAPDSAPVIEQLVDLDLLANDTAAARHRVETLQAREPDKAMPHLLFAKISFAMKDLTQAEAELLKAIELQPETYAAYYLLAGIYSQTAQDKKALDQLIQLSLKNPTSAALFMRIALLHEQLKETAAARDAYEKVLLLKPGFIPALNNLAYLLTAQPDTLKRGLAMAQKARELAPYDPNIADTLGWILYQQAQYQQARTLLFESANKLPDEPVVHFHLGLAQYMMGDMESARLNLQRALQLNPQLPEKDLINQRLAILGTDETQSDPTQRSTLEKAVAANPKDPVALTRLGLILENAGKFDQAKINLEAARAINPSNMTASLSLIRVLLARHETQAALELAKFTRKQSPDNPIVGHQLGRVAFQTGDYQWASSLLQESARKLPDDLEILWDQAKASYSIGRVADAEEIFRRIQQTQPRSPSADEVSRYLTMIALTTKPNSTDSAQIDQALKADPSFVPALIALGARAEKDENVAAAEQAYEKALALYPDFAPAKRSLALLAAAAAESAPKAYTLGIQAREAYPNDPAVCQALGILTYRKGDFSRTVSLLKESITRQGENARPTFYLGMAQFRLKDPAAKSALLRAIELGIKDQDLIEARQAIAEIK